MVTLYLIIIAGCIYGTYRYMDLIGKIFNIIGLIRHTPWSRQKLYIKIFTKGLYLTIKNRILNLYLKCIAIFEIFLRLYNLKNKNNTTNAKYKIIGAINEDGDDISWLVKEYFRCVDMPTTQSLEQYLLYNEMVILFLCVDNKPQQLTIDLLNRRIVEQNRSLIGGLITFDDEEEEIAELSE